MEMHGLEKADPPAHDYPYVPTREEIGEVLNAFPGEWFIVGRHDRFTRGRLMARRINEGREYGIHHEAKYVQVGREHRVYARKVTQ